MTTVEAILEMYRRRKAAAGVIAGRMREIRDAYNGDVVIALPELERSERAAIANLTAMGLDQIGTRIASTMPDVQYPIRRPGIRTEETRSRDRRQATLGWWDGNRMNLKLRRRARWLVGYGIAPVVIRPDFERGYPRWELKDPLGSYPAPSVDPDDPCCENAIFAVRRSLDWLRDRYPAQTAMLAKERTCNGDTLFDVLEYMDADELVIAAVGQTLDPQSDETAFNGAAIVQLERLANRSGLCPAVIPGRINLERRQGQFDGMIGMHQMQARLFALETIAVERGIFPDEWLIAEQGRTPEVIQVANGRIGQIGMVKDGQLRQQSLQPGYQTNPTIDRLERSQRLTGGIPAEFGGESASNVRTGRRGENILSATIDFGIQEAQQIFAASLEAENCRAIAVDKGYHDTAKSFYVTWEGAKGAVDYTPSELFTTDQQFVTYAQAGADVNGLVIAAGQRVGMGTLSKLGMMRLDPLVPDPESEHDQVIYEALEMALLQSTQQQAAAGSIPPNDLARIMQLVVSNKADLADAIVKAHEEAQARQAAQVPANDPAAQPGLAQPGMGAESQGQPAAPPDLASLLSQLRGPQQTTGAERPMPQAAVGA